MDYNEYDPESESIHCWLDCLERAFLLHEVVDGDKLNWTYVLLMRVGAESVRSLNNDAIWEQVKVAVIADVGDPNDRATAKQEWKALTCLDYDFK